jgi:ComF family protein
VNIANGIHPRVWPIWDLFFPPLCAICGRSLEPQAVLFCRQCWADAPVADAHDLHPLKHADVVRAAYRFGGDDVVRGSVHALKFEGMKRLADVMVRQMIPRLPVRYLEAEVIWCPVPLHWLRRVARGFNQSRLLAEKLAAATGHSAPISLLRRTRATPSQTSRSYRERAANVRGAFAVRRFRDLPESVLLIDDVVTTGATVDECARTLKAAGVKWVGALAFALTHAA